MRIVSRLLVAGLFLLACLAGLSTAARPALAAAGDGTTQLFDVSLHINTDGSVDVVEHIVFNFIDNSHGIERYIPTSYPVNNDYNRILTISNVRATSPSGAPTSLKTQEQGGVFYIRVGNPDRTVIGKQSYVLSYRVTGALNSVNGRAELYWNAIGDQWATEIQTASVTVTAPKIAQATCFVGPAGSTALCGRASVTSQQAKFAHRHLPSDTPMTVVTAVPAGLVTVPAPVLEHRWTIQRAFTANLVHLLLTGIVLVSGVGLVVYVAYRRGRDRRFRDQVPGLTPAPGQAAPEDLRPWGASAEGPVEWSPPGDARPGLIGTLIDERADVLDVTATIVDLAVRGYLRIDELPRQGWFGSRDWKLVKLKDDDGSLLAYERSLFDALFKSGAEVQLSDLKRHFATELSKVESKLYDEMVYRKWYNRRPDSTRSSWSLLAVVAIAAAGGITYLFVKYTTFGLVGIALVLAALALLLAARFMPARTGTGSAVLAQSLGFKRYLATAEAGQLKFEEAEQVFSKFLPYAIVFGVADHWAKVFQELAAAGAVTASATGLYWYTAPGGNWSFGDFGSSINSFATTSAGSLTSAAASGGSGFGGGGFSGGGFGGGGGGGW